VGNNNGDPTAKIECTIGTVSGWMTTASNDGTDWSYTTAS
jgi:hypothetical protein